MLAGSCSSWSCGQLPSNIILLSFIAHIWTYTCTLEPCSHRLWLGRWNTFFELHITPCKTRAARFLLFKQNMFERSSWKHVKICENLWNQWINFPDEFGCPWQLVALLKAWATNVWGLLRGIRHCIAKYDIYHISYIISHIEYISDEFRQNLDLDSPVQYPQHIKIDFYMKLPSVISVGSGYWYEMVWLSYVECHTLCLCTPLSVNVHRGWNACLWWFTMLYMVLRSLLPHCLLLNWVESDVST